jgi:hypothetical protein
MIVSPSPPVAAVPVTYREVAGRGASARDTSMLLHHLADDIGRDIAIDRIAWPLAIAGRLHIGQEQRLDLTRKANLKGSLAPLWQPIYTGAAIMVGAGLNRHREPVAADGLLAYCGHRNLHS